MTKYLQQIKKHHKNFQRGSDHAIENANNQYENFVRGLTTSTSILLPLVLLMASSDYLSRNNNIHLNYVFFGIICLFSITLITVFLSNIVGQRFWLKESQIVHEGIDKLYKPDIPEDKYAEYLDCIVDETLSGRQSSHNYVAATGFYCFVLGIILFIYVCYKIILT